MAVGRKVQPPTVEHPRKLGYAIQNLRSSTSGATNKKAVAPPDGAAGTVGGAQTKVEELQTLASYHKCGCLSARTACSMRASFSTILLRLAALLWIMSR